MEVQKIEINTAAGLVSEEGIIERFRVVITEENFRKAKLKIELERKKSINLLRALFAEKKILSMSKPRNQEIQSYLDNIVGFNTDMKSSINKIKDLWYR